MQGARRTYLAKKWWSSGHLSRALNQEPGLSRARPNPSVFTPMRSPFPRATVSAESGQKPHQIRPDLTSSRRSAKPGCPMPKAARAPPKWSNTTGTGEAATSPLSADIIASDT
jgi:hypothetical protein